MQEKFNKNFELFARNVDYLAETLTQEQYDALCILTNSLGGPIMKDKHNVRNLLGSIIRHGDFSLETCYKVAHHGTKSKKRRRKKWRQKTSR